MYVVHKENLIISIVVAYVLSVSSACKCDDDVLENIRARPSNRSCKEKADIRVNKYQC